MRSEFIPKVHGPAIICAQAGHVSTGACDSMEEICARARDLNAWVHVDGAFGMWAAVAPKRAHLVRGIQGADSWATDAHKWLNVPYDSGLAFVRDEPSLRAAMAVGATYLTQPQRRQPDEYVPEMSRHARGVEVWAALKSLGRAGLADMIEGCCQHAQFFAEGLRQAKHEVLNEVVLNQVLVSFGSDDVTRRVILIIKQDGTCWCGGTVRHGRAAMRISVSSWMTSQEDCERSLAVILKIASEELAWQESGKRSQTQARNDIICPVQ
jgi:glutamate/tyrosine decarboxylase-like PLP-dependent enzyme